MCPPPGAVGGGAREADDAARGLGAAFLAAVAGMGAPALLRAGAAPAAAGPDGFGCAFVNVVFGGADEVYKLFKRFVNVDLESLL